MQTALHVWGETFNPLPEARYTVALSRNCRFASATIYWLTSTVHCCSLTQLPLCFSHNLLAYFNGSLLLSHATAVLLQPQSIGLLQRYTVALSRNCRFTSAIILRPTSAPHRCIPSRLRFIRQYSSGVYLSTSRRLRRLRPCQPDSPE